MHLFALAWELLLTGQVVQLGESGERANVPAAHGVHAVSETMPRPEENVPIAHSVHLVRPISVVYVPAEQVVQLVEAAVPANAPAAHGVHAVSEGMPRPVENVPAAHAVHWGSPVAVR